MNFINNYSFNVLNLNIFSEAEEQEALLRVLQLFYEIHRNINRQVAPLACCLLRAQLRRV